MQDNNRIDALFDFEDEDKINYLRSKYNELTDKALKLANEEGDVDEETALMNRDRAFYENLLKAIEFKEKEIGIHFTPSEKNKIIDRFSQIVNATVNK
jgi:NDP-sugar pyrophosphorylase family protein